MKNAQQFRTKDFYSACLLRALRFELSKVDRNNQRFVEFVFLDPAVAADTLLSKYWNRDLLVEAKDLIDAIHDMKTILYSKT